MPSIDKKKIILFNINGLRKDSSNKGVSMLHTELPDITQKSIDIELDKLENAEALITKLWEEVDQNNSRIPILNFQFENNNISFGLLEEMKTVLNTLKDFGIKVCCSFQHYYNEEEEDKKLHFTWKTLFPQVDHVFFNSSDDREVAIAKGHIDKDRSTSTNITSVIKLLKEAVKNLKEDADARILVTNVPLDKADDITDLIMTKFSIGGDDKNDRINLRVGIMAEVEEFLSDPVNARKKLEKYISTISNQFQKDQIDPTKVGNPIDIKLEPTKSLFEDNKYAKYTIFINMQERINELKQQNLEGIATALNEIVTEQIPNSRTTNLMNHQYLMDSLYLYEDEDIRKLLNLSVDPEKVGISVHVSINKTSKDVSSDAEINKKEVLVKTISQAVEEVLKDRKEKYLLGIHIDDGGSLADHWVGLAITKDKNNRISFYYTDSLGYPLSNKPILEEVVKSQMKSLEDPKLHDLSVRQQKEDVNCGAFLVDNLTKIAKGEEKEIIILSRTNCTAQELREKHSKMLTEEFEKKKINEFINKTPLPFNQIVGTYRPSVTPQMPSSLIRGRQ